ncbi:MAG: hypothetical protein ABIG45_03505 [Bacillota bacterium]
MKTFRIAGAVFCVFGFFFALIGILTSLFPLIENEHFKLILNSFQETSTDALTNTLNVIVRFCLRSSYFLLFCGISLMVTGGLISSSAHKRQLAAAGAPAAQPVSPPASETLGVPRPAYYPGGLAPPVISFHMIKKEDEPLDFGGEPAKNTGPISGGVELSLSSDESDAQRLMRQDRQLTAHKQPEYPVNPDYALYLSNTAPEETPSKSAETLSPTPSGKPKIVSTIGKRTR